MTWLDNPSGGVISIPITSTGRDRCFSKTSILSLQRFWADKGCVIHQPYDIEVGAGTFNPATFLRALGPEPWNTAYVEPSRRPTDGRYGENPNRLQHYYQFQVIMKPCPYNYVELYLDSLRAVGIDPLKHDIRFVEDDWESPTLGAWGLGWEVWLDGMEITQFTYFQQCGGIDLKPVTGEITYGVERIAMYLQNVNNVFDLKWVGDVTYGDVHHRGEVEWSAYNFEAADIPMLFSLFTMYEKECLALVERKLVLPAYDYCLKCSHAFNMLDARGAISVTERTSYIGRVRNLARFCAEGFLRTREEMGFPLLGKFSGESQKPPAKRNPDGTRLSARDRLRGNPGGVRRPRALVRRPAVRGDAEEGPSLLPEGRHLGHAAAADLRDPGPRGPAGGVERDRDGSAEKRGTGRRRQADEGRPGIREVPGDRRLGPLGLPDRSRRIPRLRSRGGGPPGPGDPSEDRLRFPPRDPVQEVDAVGRPRRPVRAPGPLDRLAVRRRGAAVLVRQRHGGAHDLRPPVPCPRGHRTSLDPEYPGRLAEARVLVDLEDRKGRIRAGMREVSGRIGMKWVEDEPLVETVANLVEYPVVMVGRFEEKYLSLPREVLVTSMRNNQKYFVFEDAKGGLFPGFAFVSNMIVPDESVVVAGNERVLRARLSDAEFYYGDDLKMPLFERAEALKKVLFQADMGTYWEKVERMADIAAFVASFGFPGKAQDCRRAAFLSKADLTTGVVKEFPELQGVMGRHYASKTGESAEIAQSVFEHYLPKGQSDDLPSTDVGAATAIADKIDMVCGCFGVGLIPTGTADPYGLRRHTLGILSILESRGLRIPIEELVDRSLATLAAKLTSPAAEVRRKVLEFVAARYLNLRVSQGTPADLVEAVLAAGLTDVVDLRAKLDALVAFRADAAFEPLAEVFKRAINITKAYDGPLAVSEQLFEHDEERALHAAPPAFRAASRRRPATAGTPRRSARWRGSSRWSPPSSKRCS